MATKLSRQERTWAAFCHLGGFGMFVIPLVGNILAPLILWMMRREDSEFVNQQGKEAINFQITLSIFGAAAGLLCFIYIGIPMTVAILVYDVAIMTMASVRTSEGESFSYPISFRFVQKEIPWLTSSGGEEASKAQEPAEKEAKAPAPTAAKKAAARKSPKKSAKKASGKTSGKSKKKSRKKSSS